MARAGRNIAGQEMVNQPIHLQRLAKGAFDRGSFAEALPLYREASALFRGSGHTNWVRVFFCEATAVRCLEELGFSDEGWAAEYQEELARFVSEWNTDRLTERIRGDRRPEALATLMSRRTGRAFWSQRVDHAIEKALGGDFADAGLLLEQTAAGVAAATWIESRDAVVAIIRSKRLILGVFEELQRSEATRSIERIVKCYRDAARACTIRREKGDLLERLRGFREFYLSHALKWLAFNDLRGIDQRRVPAAFAHGRAALRLKRAAALAEAAAVGPAGISLPRPHAPYLAYWSHTVAMRLHAQLALTTTDAGQIERARSSWNAARAAAARFVDLAGEASLFPNRFYSLADLENEQLLLNAYEAALREDWASLSGHLAAWCDAFPGDFAGSWRHIQGRIRAVFAKCLASALPHVGGELLGTITELRRIGPIGRSAEQLLGYAELAAKRPLATNAATEILRECRPLLSFDSAVAAPPNNEAFDPVSALPRQLGYLLSVMPPVEAAPYATWRSAFLCGWEVLLRTMADYYEQHCGKGPRNTLSWSLPNGRSGTLPLPDTVANKISGAWSMCDKAIRAIWEMPPTNLQESFGEARHLLTNVAMHAPVVVDIRETSVHPVKAFPDWSVRDLEIQILGAERLTPGRYYLPPSYRFGYRHLYRILPGSPLFPATYQPNWYTLLDDLERQAFTTLFVLRVKERLAAEFRGEVRDHYKFVYRDADGHDQRREADIVIVGEDRDVVVEVSLRFSGDLNDPFKVTQASACAKAYREANGRNALVVLVTNAQPSPDVLAAARTMNVEVRRAVLQPQLYKCIPDPRRMNVARFEVL